MDDKLIKHKLTGHKPNFNPADWDKMEALLDDKQKKRFGFWWIIPGLMLGALSLYGGLHFYNSKLNKSANLTSATAKNSITNNTITTTVKPEETENTINLTEAQIEKNTNKNKHTLSNKASENNDEKTSTNAIKTGLVVSENRNVKLAPLFALTAIEPSELVNPLNHNLPQLESLNNEQTITRQKTVEHALGIQTGYLVNQTNTLAHNGYGGLFYKLIFKNRFSVQTGINLGSNQIKINNKSFNNVDYASLAFSYNVVVNQMQIAIPLVFQVDLTTKKFRPFLGVGINNIFNVKQAYGFSYTMPSAPSVGNNTGVIGIEDNSSLVGGELLNANQVNKYQLAFKSRVGFSYQLGKTWFLQTNFDYNFLPKPSYYNGHQHQYQFNFGVGVKF